MLHRVVLGSLERFMGILIEHYSGNLPPWLAPVQAIVLPISEKFLDYGNKILNILNSEGYRAQIDNRVESLGKKIRQAELRKIPYMIVVGELEEQNQTITIRRKIGQEMKDIKVEEFISLIADVVDNRKITS
jgi:threonyl-tRNA synthetase